MCGAAWRECDPYRRGGKPNPDAPQERLPQKAANKSWQPGQPGQGGEGLSKGYGGSATREVPQVMKQMIARPNRDEPSIAHRLSTILNIPQQARPR